MGHKATKAKLLARRLGSDTVTVDGVGDLVVRALNRDEGIRVAEAKTTADKDLITLTLGIVDPELSEDDVRAWSSSASAGEIEAVSRRIAELSKLVPEAPKEQYKSFRGESES